MAISRREFLGRAGAVALGFYGLRSYLSAGAADLPTTASYAPYGPLLPDPHKIIDLPQGFTYRVISRAGEKMNDGLRVPDKQDGMAAFAGPNGLTILVRNHELSADDSARGPFGEDNL